MAVCPKCGDELKEGARFCAKCGHSLVPGAKAAELGDIVPTGTQIKQGPANLRRGGWERVGGQLTLTDRELVFDSHDFNIQRGASSWPLTSIQSAAPFNDLGLVPNGLRVQFVDGTDLKFNVSGRDEWAAQITTAAAAAKGVPATGQ